MSMDAPFTCGTGSLNLSQQTAQRARHAIAVLLIVFLSACRTDPLPKEALPTADPVQITTGYYHACVLTSLGQVKCWGNNEFGQLGYGDTDNRGDEPGEIARLPYVDIGERAVSVTAGGYHTCALLESQRVKCWGDNHYGTLGLGDTEHRGDEPGEMGHALPYADLGEEIVLQMSSGARHACALFESLRVKCWGYNYRGHLGQGHRINLGVMAGQMGEDLPYVDVGPLGVRSVRAGDAHTCVILDDYSVKCWGANRFGQLGLGDTDARGDNPGEMGDNLPAVDLHSDSVPVEVISHYEHTCALFENGTTQCWGDNKFAQLGLGDKENRGDEPGEMGAALPNNDWGGVVATNSSVPAGEEDSS